MSGQPFSRSWKARMPPRMAGTSASECWVLPAVWWTRRKRTSSATSSPAGSASVHSDRGLTTSPGYTSRTACGQRSRRRVSSTRSFPCPADEPRVALVAELPDGSAVAVGFGLREERPAVDGPVARVEARIQVAQEHVGPVPGVDEKVERPVVSPVVVELVGRQGSDDHGPELEGLVFGKVVCVDLALRLRVAWRGDHGVGDRPKEVGREDLGHELHPGVGFEARGHAHHSPEALSAGPPLLPLSIWPSVRMKFRYPPSEPKLNTLPGVTVKSPPGAGYPSVTMRSPSATVAVGAQSRYTSNSPSTSMTATSGC